MNDILTRRLSRASPGVERAQVPRRRRRIRVELRDDLLIERRKLTQTTHFKQNANITIGFTMLSAVKEKRR